MMWSREYSILQLEKKLDNWRLLNNLEIGQVIRGSTHPLSSFHSGARFIISDSFIQSLSIPSCRSRGRQGECTQSENEIERGWESFLPIQILVDTVTSPDLPVVFSDKLLNELLRFLDTQVSPPLLINEY